jgi:hypothetical protein
MSASAKGNYYKLRSKRWLEAKGYAVAFMERMLWIPPHRPGDRMIPVKRDQFASDLLAMTGDELIFVQVKFGATRRGAGNIAAARREFAKHTFFQGSQQWLVIWEPRAREPEIVDCTPELQAVVNG